MKTKLLFGLLVIAFMIGIASADNGMEISKLSDYSPEQFQELLK